MIRSTLIVMLALVFLSLGCAPGQATPRPCELETTVKDLASRMSLERPELYLVSVSSCEVRTLDLTIGLTQAPVLELAWSPSGDFLALVLGWAVPSRFTAGLYMASVSDSGLTEVVSAPDVDKDSLGWSPDGKWLTFRQGGDLWITRPDGSQMTNLTPAPDQVSGEYLWSPTNRWLAFRLQELDAQDGRWYSHLAVASMEKDPPEVRTLITRRGHVNIQWMPDGERMVGRFLSEEPVMVVKAHDGGREPLHVPKTPGVVIPSYTRATLNVVWSPDGKKAAIPCNLPLNGEGDILSPPYVCVTKADLSDAKPVHKGEFLSWSPDSRYLAVNDSGRFYTLQPNGKDLHRVTQYPKRVQAPEWYRGDRKPFYIEENLIEESGLRWASSKMGTIETILRMEFLLPGPQSDLHLVARDGSWDVRVGPSRTVHVSPDGKWVAVRSPVFGTM